VVMMTEMPPKPCAVRRVAVSVGQLVWACRMMVAVLLHMVPPVQMALLLRMVCVLVALGRGQ